MTTKELLALVGKATPGPWVAEDGCIVNRECELYPDDDRMAEELSWDVGQIYHPDNLALIVTAVNSLPALCAEVEALRKDAERLDWLAFHGAAIRQDPFTGQHYIVAPYHTGIGTVDGHERHADFRAAIDAAKEPK